MATWKAPPKAKIYEALSAVGDGRVEMVGERTAQVTSSARDTTYTVEWSEDGKGITSNDNASYWQGYPGYPILAVLMVRTDLNFSPRIASSLSGVAWKQPWRRSGLGGTGSTVATRTITSAVACASSSRGPDSRMSEEIRRPYAL